MAPDIQRAKAQNSTTTHHSHSKIKKKAQKQKRLLHQSQAAHESDVHGIADLQANAIRPPSRNAANPEVQEPNESQQDRPPIAPSTSVDSGRDFPTRDIQSKAIATARTAISTTWMSSGDGDLYLRNEAWEQLFLYAGVEPRHVRSLANHMSSLFSSCENGCAVPWCAQTLHNKARGMHTAALDIHDHPIADYVKLSQGLKEFDLDAVDTVIVFKMLHHGPSSVLGAVSLQRVHGLARDSTFKQKLPMLHALFDSIHRAFVDFVSALEGSRLNMHELEELFRIEQGARHFDPKSIELDRAIELVVEDEVLSQKLPGLDALLKDTVRAALVQQKIARPDLAGAIDNFTATYLDIQPMSVDTFDRQQAQLQIKQYLKLAHRIEKQYFGTSDAALQAKLRLDMKLRLDASMAVEADLRAHGCPYGLTLAWLAKFGPDQQRRNVLWGKYDQAESDADDGSIKIDCEVTDSESDSESRPSIQYKSQPAVKSKVPAHSKNAGGKAPRPTLGVESSTGELGKGGTVDNAGAQPYLGLESRPTPGIPLSQNADSGPTFTAPMLPQSTSFGPLGPTWTFGSIAGPTAPFPPAAVMGPPLPLSGSRVTNTLASASSAPPPPSTASKPLVSVLSQKRRNEEYASDAVNSDTTSTTATSNTGATQGDMQQAMPAAHATFGKLPKIKLAKTKVGNVTQPATVLTASGAESGGRGSGTAHAQGRQAQRTRFNHATPGHTATASMEVNGGAAQRDMQHGSRGANAAHPGHSQSSATSTAARSEVDVGTTSTAFGSGPGGPLGNLSSHAGRFAPQITNPAMSNAGGTMPFPQHAGTSHDPSDHAVAAQDEASVSDMDIVQSEGNVRSGPASRTAESPQVSVGPSLAPQVINPPATTAALQGQTPSTLPKRERLKLMSTMLSEASGLEQEWKVSRASVAANAKEEPRPLDPNLGNLFRKIMDMVLLVGSGNERIGALDTWLKKGSTSKGTSRSDYWRTMLQEHGYMMQ